MCNKPNHPQVYETTLLLCYNTHTHRHRHTQSNWCSKLASPQSRWCRSHTGFHVSCCLGNWVLNQERCYTPNLQTSERETEFVCVKTVMQAHVSVSRASPAMSRERFLSVLMGLSLRRSNGLLLRSDTFCFRRERSFRFGSDAAMKDTTTGSCFHVLPHFM